ncbi:hypothetical protein GCM10020331_088840 [Ectobacillus funiculus]
MPIVLIIIVGSLFIRLTLRRIIFLWTAIYGGKESIQGLSVAQMTTYVAVAWMARAFYFNNIDREIAAEIKEGRVAVELIRPYSYLGMKVMQGLGEGIFFVCSSFSIPGMILVVLLFSLSIKLNPYTLLYFFISLFVQFYY